MTQLTIEEILKKVPALKRYEGNPEAIRTVYAELNPKKDLSGLIEGEFVNGAEVLIVRILNESFYIGCPTCFTKKDGMEEGVVFDCPRDATHRESQPNSQDGLYWPETRLQRPYWTSHLSVTNSPMATL